MHRNDPLVLITRDGADKIRQSELDFGELVMRHVESDNMYVVAGVETSRKLVLDATVPGEYAALRREAPHRSAAQWLRRPGDNVNVEHLLLRSRPHARWPFDDFKDRYPEVHDPGTLHGIVVTHDPDVSPELTEIGVAEFAGWLIHRSGVRPMDIQVEPETLGLEQLQDLWPIKQLGSHSVMVVGCGSIGGAAAEALAGYGIGHLELVDPDRFLWHNMIRHILGPESVGLHKATALKAHLQRRWPSLHVTANNLDVVTDAHHIRRACKDIDLVLCTADGIAPRRVVSHLARRADKPAILACVLDRGAIGEIIRLRPSPRFGCLLCLRDHLSDHGAMDAEADQELGYGTGRVHQPMTAVPPDLRHLGTLAAKVSVATLLESRHGDRTQRLPGEHAILGLHPGGDLARPFDMRESGVIHWASIPPPRAKCPTCGVR